MASSQRIFTHLWYARDAEKAANLYASIFPDSLVDRVWALPDLPDHGRLRKERRGGLTTSLAEARWTD
jgi:predicted 3-demethylubiquinone-9 3-methyltransferase (glyoxalase superfamily)